MDPGWDTMEQALPAVLSNLIAVAAVLAVRVTIDRMSRDVFWNEEMQRQAVTTQAHAHRVGFHPHDARRGSASRRSDLPAAHCRAGRRPARPDSPVHLRSTGRGIREPVRNASNRRAKNCGPSPTLPPPAWSTGQGSCWSDSPSLPRCHHNRGLSNNPPARLAQPGDNPGVRDSRNAGVHGPASTPGRR